MVASSRKRAKKRRLVRDLSNVKFKEAITSSLQKYTPDYKLVSVNNNRRTNHAQLIDATLKREDDYELSVVAKRYLHMGRSTGKYHKLFNNPNSLQSRESRNLNNITDISGSGKVPASHLVDTDNNMSVIKRIHGESSWIKLVNIVKQLEDKPTSKLLYGEMKSVLYEFVGGIARFVGSVNAYHEEFHQKYPSYYREAKEFSAANEQLLKENFRKLMVPKKSTSRIDDLVGKLWGLKKKAFHDRELFVHGDFHANHLIIPDQYATEEEKEPVTIDLETFHIDYESTDLGSALVIHPIGNNYIIRGGEFSNLINRYLALEHAYEKKDDEAITVLKQAENGEFAEYLRETKLGKEEYNNFLLGVFANAMVKQLQLPIIYHKRKKRAGMNEDMEERKKNDANYLHTLFLELMGMDPIFDNCTAPDQFRDYFHTLGQISEEVGYLQFHDGFLDGIKKGTISTEIIKGHPFI